MVSEVVEVEVRRSWGCRAWRTSSARRGRGSPWWPPPPATPRPSTSTWGAASTPPASTPSPSEYRLEDHHILDKRILFHKTTKVTKATLRTASPHLKEYEQWTLTILMSPFLVARKWVSGQILTGDFITLSFSGWFTGSTTFWFLPELFRSCISYSIALLLDGTYCIVYEGKSHVNPNKPECGQIHCQL